jgi:hypothetical protein
MSTSTADRAVIDHARAIVESAGLDVYLVDDLPAPLMVRDLYDLAVVVGCPVADFLNI